MNCREYKRLLLDYKRDADSDPAFTEHSQSCSDCAALLCEQQALAVTLAELRQVTALEEAPVRVQNHILADWRRRRDAAYAPEAMSFGKAGWRPSGYRRVVLAFAAGLLLIGGLGVAALLTIGPPEQLSVRKIDRRDGKTKTFGDMMPSSRSAAGQQTVTKGTGMGSPQIPPRYHRRNVDEGKGGERAPAQRAGGLAKATGRDMPPAVAETKTAQRAEDSVARDGKAAPAAEELEASVEETTEFIPTMYVNENDSGYSFQVVRVQVPRTTMASFGLPVDPRKLNKPVKADLLIGQDGLARAIRFVSE